MAPNEQQAALGRMTAANRAAEVAREELTAGMDAWDEASTRISSATDQPSLALLHAKATAAGQRVRVLMDASEAAGREATAAATAAVDALFPPKPRTKRKR